MTGKQRSDAQSVQRVRHDLKQAERGDDKAAEDVHRMEHKRPESAEAAEQELSDGPPKRGVDR